MKENIESKMRVLSETQTAVPPTFVWENIEKVLHPKPIGRFGLIIFLGLIAFASGIVLLGYYSQQKMKSQNVEFITTKSIQDNSNSIVNYEDNSESPIIEETNSIDQAENNSENISAELPIVEDHKRNSNTLILSEGNNSKALIVGADMHKDNAFADTDKGTSNDAISIPAIPSVQDKPTQQAEVLPRLSKLGFSGLLREDLKPYLMKDDIICPSFNGRKKMSPFVTLGLLGGMHTKSIPNGDNAVLAAQRNQTESSWYTWGAYGSIGLNITPQFYAGVGVDWTQSKDKFHDESEAITKMVITFDPTSGQPTDTSFTTGKFINKGEIRYNSLDIPVFIGFHKQLNTWDLGVELGGLLNVKFAATGKIINESLMVSRIENEPAIYKDNLSFGIKASLVVRKNFSNGFSLELKPTFKTYLSTINDPTYPLPMKMNVFGLNVGIRKDFQTKSFVIK